MIHDHEAHEPAGSFSAFKYPAKILDVFSVSSNGGKTFFDAASCSVEGRKNLLEGPASEMFATLEAESLNHRFTPYGFSDSAL